MENEDVSEGLDEWVVIQSSSPTNGAQLYKDDNSVLNRDGFFSDSAVLPPGNHEDLPISPPHGIQPSEVLHRFSSSSSSSLLSSSDGDANGKVEEEEVEDESRSGITWGMACLRYRIVELASQMRNYAASKARIWLFASATTGLGALLFIFLLYLRVQRRRRQVKLESKQHLMFLNLMQEKDQKINELALQVARLNDILLDRRRVPVLRV